MKKITLPFFISILLTSYVFAGQVKSLRLKGRVPASVKIVENNKENSDPLLRVKTNMKGEDFTVKKIKKKGHEFIEISFH